LLDVWRLAAPHAELAAPDIYMEDFKGVCFSYTRAGNPLLIPEARNSPLAAATALYAFARHDAICFAPFAIDDCPETHPLRESYALLANMAGPIAQHQGTGRIYGLLQTQDEKEEFDLGGYFLRARFAARKEGSPPAAGLVIAPAPGEFIIAGFGFRIEFVSLDAAWPKVDFIAIDEGVFRDGQWISGRRLNGDEYSIGLGPTPCARWVKVYAHR
jgi:hypothetical protein